MKPECLTFEHGHSNLEKLPGENKGYAPGIEQWKKSKQNLIVTLRYVLKLPQPANLAQNLAENLLKDSEYCWSRWFSIRTKAVMSYEGP